MKDEVDFLQINTKWQSYEMYVARHARITQNNNFAISLQYLRKELSHKVDFLHADKHESLLEIDAMILIGMLKHSQSSQNSKFTMSFWNLKKEMKNRWNLHADIHQSFLKIDFNTLIIKVSYKVILSLLIGMIKHSQSTQRNKFAISLQSQKRSLEWNSFFAFFSYKLVLLFW